MSDVVINAHICDFGLASIGDLTHMDESFDIARDRRLGEFSLRLVERARRHDTEEAYGGAYVRRKGL